MPILCSRASKVKVRRVSSPTVTDVRKAELQHRRERELSKRALPVVDTRALSTQQHSAMPSVTNSLDGITLNSSVSQAESPTVTQARTIPPSPQFTRVAAPHDDDKGALSTTAAPENSSLLMSQSTFMCCSIRVADQPEDAGYYIYPVELHTEKVKLCSTAPPARAKPLDAHRPAPIFVPFEEY